VSLHDSASGQGIVRRDFIKGLACGSAAVYVSPSHAVADATNNTESSKKNVEVELPLLDDALDLSPAKWIWYPSERCLQNTFILFRRMCKLEAPIRSAKGWMVADSRYQLFVNGQRIQWGPAPSDPRWLEVDPLELSSALKVGENVIGVQVLFYGQGDGTWPVGKPGLLFSLDIETADGRKESMVSDSSWQAHLARSWPPGHYKRWYLRSLQEEFDAMLFPYGWATTDFKPDDNWLSAQELAGPANKPAICTRYPEYMLEIQGDKNTTALRPRSVPMMREYNVPIKRLAESFSLKWHRPVEEYFECLPPNAFTATPVEVAETSSGVWRLQLAKDQAAALTFELEEQVVGWPYFTIEAPEGTVIELLVHEAHALGGPALLNTHFHSWSRFICRKGVNHFETFDFESLRWLQLHIHNAQGMVTISEVGVRRRIFPWPNEPKVSCFEPKLQHLFDACINTLHNSAQETAVDGMARERQQYSGDGGHQLHAIYSAFGETRLPRRFITTFSQGMTLDGYFLDCWPAYDRLARLFERQMQLTGWGPILDHGVGLNFDCFYYYSYTGDLDGLREPYPRLVRFFHYLKSIQTINGLLPVENIGIPSVWIDHDAYRQQRQKQCAFNLYVAAMLKNALAVMARALNDSATEKEALDFAQTLLETTIKNFWSWERGLFVNNLPWLGEEKDIRLCDRSLATAILFDQCPDGQFEPALEVLADCPPEMGLSYPANAGWRLWALAKGGRIDVVLRDFRQRWATMSSVLLNNTLQESWEAAPDSGSQWSHCAVVPLYVLFMSIAGIQPLTPGFKRCSIRPQLGDLEKLDLTAYTVQGPIIFKSKGKLGKRELRITLPVGCEGELVVNAEESLQLPKVPVTGIKGMMGYRLLGGKEFKVILKYS